MMSQRRVQHQYRSARARLASAIEALESRTLFAVSTINAADDLRAVATNLLGVNTATWDGQLSTSATLSLSQAAGLDAVRLPGGSSSDTYHFNANPSYNQSMGQMAEYAARLDATTVVTVNYGTGSPQEGVALWAYLCGSPTDTTPIGSGGEFNTSTNTWTQVNWQTVGYWASLREASPLASDDGLNFLRLGPGSSVDHPGPFTVLDWEMGNEEYGSWETDGHNVQGSGLTMPTAGEATAQHDPTTYVAFCKEFSTEVRSIIQAEGAPAIQIGIDSQSTGSDFGNWIANVLLQCKSQQFIPDFISDHIYDQSPGDEKDSTLLAEPTTPQKSTGANTYDLAQRATEYESLISTDLGAAGANIQLLATEMNSVSSSPGKQSTSLVNGLFLADSLGSMMETAYNGAWIWDLHNGEPDPDGNTASSLYGWREYGDYGILGNGSGAAVNEPSPDYFAEQLLSKIVTAGGTVVSATSDSSLLDTFAVLEPDGHLELLVINKNPPSAGPPNNLPDPSITEQFNVANFVASGAATVWQYGVAQDDAQATGSAAALSDTSTTLNIASGAFSLAIPNYSMSVIDLAPVTQVAGSALYLKEDSDGQHLDIWNNATGAGSYAEQIPLYQLPGLTIAATAGSGTFVFDLSNGNFIPAAGMNFDGNAASVMEVLGSGESSVYAYAGSFTINGDPIDYTGSTGATVFNPEGGDDSLWVGSGASLTVPAASNGGMDDWLLNSISIASGARLTVSGTSSASERSCLVLSSLFIAWSNGAPTGRLDLGETDMDVVGGNLATVTQDLATGMNTAAASAGSGTLWQGEGICSSAAAGAGMALGMIRNDQNGVEIYGAAAGATFDGYDPAFNDLLVRYTCYGDANLDGVVNTADYLLIDNGFNFKMSGWYNGDFNYDGVVNGDDYSLIDNAFNLQNAAAAQSVIVAANSSRPTSASAVAARSNPAAGPAAVIDGQQRPATIAAASALPSSQPITPIGPSAEDSASTSATSADATSLADQLLLAASGAAQ